MTLDEAVTYFAEEAERRKRMSQLDGSFVTETRNEQEKRIHAEAAKNNKQIAEWLMELKELRSLKTDYVFFKAETKKLLKAAVEDINFYVDCYEAHCDECCCDHDNHCHWKHEAEALKLIGGTDND